MASWLNGPALSLVHAATVLATPGILGQRGHCVAQRVIDRDTQAVPIHLGHHATKVGTMVRTTLQNIVLPLVNHFVRQSHDSVVALLGVVLLKENRR